MTTRGIHIGLLAFGLALVSFTWMIVARDANPVEQRWTEGLVGTAKLINPLLAEPDSVDADLAALLFNGLIRIDSDGMPLPDLAEHWEITPDGQTYTIVLRKNLTWHDGRPVTTTDVATTISLLQDKNFPGSPGLAANWVGIDSYVINERTILFRLPAPSSDFLSRLDIGIIPNHLYDAADSTKLASAAANLTPIGTGPYRLTSLKKDRALLERNTSYHRGAPTIDQIELHFYSTTMQLLEALSEQEFDALLFGEEASLNERAAILERRELVATPLTRHAFTILYLNNQRAPFDDPAIRRAIATSIEPANIIREAEISALPGAGVLIPGSWSYSTTTSDNSEKSSASHAYNEWTTAGYSLNETGHLHKQNRELHLEILTSEDLAHIRIAQAVADALDIQGVKATVIPLPTNELLSKRLLPHDYELAVFGWEVNTDPDPYLGWHTSQISENRWNIAGYQDPIADALLENARQTVDMGERRQLYTAFEKRFVSEAASIVLTYPYRLYVHPQNLENFEPGLLFEPSDRFRNIHLWNLDIAE